MRILFIHQNMPGQFEHMARHLAKSPANEVWFITCRDDRPIAGVNVAAYKRPPRDEVPQGASAPDMSGQQQFIRHGLVVGRICIDLKKKGFRPDIIVAHPGWGEALFVKDVFPDVPLLNYCEFYYRPFGSDRDFYPGEGNTWSGVFATRVANTHLLHSLTSCDYGLSPTNWQMRQHPQEMRHKISVIHDGIDTRVLRPNSAAQFKLPNGRVLTPADEVVTYGVRNLEKYRGFDMFMRAVPEICRRHPQAQIVIAGGDEIIGAAAGRRLFESYVGPKAVQEFPRAGHNDVAGQPSAWWQEVFSFWQQAPVATMK
jgi:glycosyltransferase involved in cell wall biosynthesis